MGVPTHPRPQEEADSLCKTFAHRCSTENLPERTNIILPDQAPEGVRIITTTYNGMESVPVVIVGVCIHGADQFSRFELTRGRKSVEMNSGLSG